MMYFLLFIFAVFSAGFWRGQHRFRSVYFPPNLSQDNVSYLRGYQKSGYSDYIKRNGMDHRYSPNMTEHMAALQRIYDIYRIEKLLHILRDPTIPDSIKQSLLEKRSSDIYLPNITAGGLMDDF